MNLEQKINEELKTAMKAGDKKRLETLRSLRAEIIAFAKSGAGREMNEDDEMKILTSQAKKRRDAIEMYEKADRNDLLENEKSQLEIINEFLPKPLTEKELTDIIKLQIEKTGASSMQDAGKVIGPVVKMTQGRASGGEIQKIVKELLSK